MKANSQQSRLLKHLQSGKSLMRLEAWDKLGIIEAPARIAELRQAGYDIITEKISVVNRYGEEVKIAKWTLAS